LIMQRLLVYLFALILFIIVLFLYFGESLLSFRNSDNQFRIDPDVKVSMVVLHASSGEKVTLIRGTDNEWTLNNTFKANRVAVEQLIATVGRLSVKRPVSVSDRQKVNENLQNEGTTVEIYKQSYLLRLPFLKVEFARNKLIRKFIIGDEADDGQANFMRLYRSDNPYIVYRPGVSSSFHEIFSSSEHLWHDPLVLDLKAREIYKLNVSIPENKKESFSIIKDNSMIFRMFDNQGLVIDMSLLDSIRFHRYTHSFRGLYYYMLLTGEQEIQAREDKINPPFAELEVCDTAGECIVISCFYRPNRKQAGRLYVENLLTDPNLFYILINEQYLALAEFFSFSRILRHKSFFLIEGPDSYTNTGNE
jgi:hypothetical protein